MANEDDRKYGDEIGRRMALANDISGIGGDDDRSVVHVGDVDHPTARLCWRQNERSMVRCDRREGHRGPHSWEYEGNS